MSVDGPSTVVVPPPRTCEDEGILQPPDTLKANIDKIASYTARNDGSESRLIADLSGNPAFGFLNPGNPYFAYYRQKVYDERKLAAPGPSKPAKSAVVAEKPPPPPQPLSPPPEEIWTLESRSEMDASHMSPLEWDLAKLAAAYVSRNGEWFQVGLWNRESRNPRFEFLQSFSSNHGVYRRLISSYTRLIDRVLAPASAAAMSAASAYHMARSRDRRGVLEDIMRRRDYEASRIKSEADRRAEEEAERSAISAIDWNDAVIVAHIAFNALENERLPEAIDQEDVMMVYGRIKTEEQAALLDAMEKARAQDLALPPAQQPQAPSHVSPPTPYSSTRRTAVMVCPICKQTVPTEELEQHMKIELSRAGAGMVEQPRAHPTERTAILASGDEVAAHLAKMAKRRKDIFGDDPEDAEDARPEQDMAPVIARPGQNPMGHPMQPFQAVQLHPQSAMRPPHPAEMMQRPNYHLAPQMMPGTAFGRPHHPAAMPPLGPYPGMPTQPPPPGFAMSGHARPPPQPQMNLMGPPPHAGPSAAFGLPRPKPVVVNRFVELIPEKQWLAQNPGPVAIQVIAIDAEAIPASGCHSVNIQTELTLTVRALKEMLAEEHGVPLQTNKQVIKIEGLGYLKDQYSLAYYNVRSGAELVLSTKERGGRKKG